MLHLIPFTSFGSNSFLDPRKMQGANLPPIFHSGFSGRYNVDGFLTTSGKEPDRAGYVQVFRNGIIESAAGDICADGRLYALDVENEVCTKLECYMDALSKTGISPPIAVLLSGVRFHGVSVFGILNAIGIEINPLSDPELHFPEVVLEQYGTIEEYRRGLKPVFDALWNAGGYPGSKSYGPDGSWVRRS